MLINTSSVYMVYTDNIVAKQTSLTSELTPLQAGEPVEPVESSEESSEEEAELRARPGPPQPQVTRIVRSGYSDFSVCLEGFCSVNTLADRYLIVNDWPC